jgi:hypothetical protein
MGRYYSGDINGKFWFAVQSSNAADRFGVCGGDPSHIPYYFEEEDLPEVEQEIKKIEESIDHKKIEAFFKANNGYNDEKLIEAEINPKDVGPYADLCLGRQIRDCIKENGSCSFDAEI